MKRWRIVVSVLWYALWMFFALTVVRMAVSAQLWEQTVDWMRSHRFWVVTGGALTLALMLFDVALRLIGRSRVDYLTFDTGHGVVSVSVRAVEDLIARIAQDFDAVRSLRAVVGVRKRRMDVTLNLRLRGGVQLPELSQRLQDRVRDALSVNLGINDVGDIRVNVQEIVPEPAHIAGP